MSLSENGSDSDQDIFAFDDEKVVLNPAEMFPPAPPSSRYSDVQHSPIDCMERLDIGKEDQRINIKDFVASAVDKRRVGLEDFVIKSVIGKGAYGQVFLVQKKESTNLFAMKVLRKASIVVHGIDTEHTQNERSILEAISHPFIVKLYYAFQCPSRLYLILTYCSGGELFNYLSQEQMFSEETTRFYIAELLLALEHLHSLGIIYR
jgi:serine/threonine protein kinase